MIKEVLLFFSLLNAFIWSILVGGDIPPNVHSEDYELIAILLLIAFLIILIGKKPLRKGSLIICIIFNILWINSVINAIKCPYQPKTYLYIDILALIGSIMCTTLSICKIYKFQNKN